MISYSNLESSRWITNRRR